MDGTSGLKKPMEGKEPDNHHVAENVPPTIAPEKMHH
jgi:hypothetical protein